MTPVSFQSACVRLSSIRTAIRSNAASSLTRLDRNHAENAAPEIIATAIS